MRIFKNYGLVSFRCGAAQFLDLGATALFGAGDYIMQQNQIDSQIAAQREENAKNREFQAAEAEKQREFATQTLKDTQAYNSSPQQVQRLEQAGINPATSFSSGAGSAGTSTPVSPGPVPSGSAGLTGFNPVSFAGSLVSLSQAYKSAAEGTTEKMMLGERLKGLVADNRIKEIEAEAKSLANDIVRKTGMRKAEAEINNIISEYELNIAKKKTELEKRNLTEAEYWTEVEKYNTQFWQTAETKMRALLGQKRYEMAEVDLRYYDAMKREELRNLRSSTVNNYASANEHNASARNFNAMSEFQEFTNDLRRTNSKQVAENYIDRLLADQAISQSEHDQAVRLLKALKWGSDADKDTDLFIRWLTTTIGVNAGVTGSVSK